MTAEPMPSATAPAAPAGPASPAARPQVAPEDDPASIRYYLGVLGRWWREILLITILAVALAAGAIALLNGLAEPMYRAEAPVAIVRTTTDVSLDERFTTTSETLVGTGITTRRNALLTLAVSPALAVEVAAELGATLPENLRHPEALANTIDATLGNGNGRGDSDLIEISATAANPELAAQIATAWAQAFVRNVNQIYGQVPNEVLASITTEHAEAEAAYTAAQQALANEMAISQQGALLRRVEDTTAAIDALRRGRQGVLDALVDRTVESRDQIARAIGSALAANQAAPFVAEQEGKRAIVLALVNALYGAQAQVIDEQASRDEQLLAGYYTRWLQATRALDEAAALRDQVAGLGADAEIPASGALVLSLLKLQAFTTATDPQAPLQLDVTSDPETRVSGQVDGETPVTVAPSLLQSTQPVQVQMTDTPLQIQLDANGTVERALLLADIDSLVTTLAQRRADLAARIEELSASMVSGASVTVPDSMPSESALAATLQSVTAPILARSVLSDVVTATPLPGLLGSGAGLQALLSTEDLQTLVAAAFEETATQAAIEELEAELRALEGELESERAAIQRLSRQRDVAQDAFVAASNKVAELSLSRAVGNSEVRLAGVATPPLLPVESVSLPLLAVVAAVAGLLLGVIVAFVAHAAGGRPWFAPRRTRQSVAQA